jgi:hypothetical protein
MLALPLELRSPYGPCRDASRGRRTEDDARAFAAALIASLLSSFASFHALILTGFLALFALSACPAASGSTDDGAVPGSKCGVTSSYFKDGSIANLAKKSLFLLPYCNISLNFQRYIMQLFIRLSKAEC